MTLETALGKKVTCKLPPWKDVDIPDPLGGHVSYIKWRPDKIFEEHKKKISEQKSSASPTGSKNANKPKLTFAEIIEKEIKELSIDDVFKLPALCSDSDNEDNN